MTDIASSIYHGLQMKAEKRFSKGLTFLGSYTFSRNINTGGDGFSLSSSPQNPDVHRMRSRSCPRSIGRTSLR